MHASSQHAFSVHVLQTLFKKKNMRLTGLFLKKNPRVKGLKRFNGCPHIVAAFAW